MDKYTLGMAVVGIILIAGMVGSIVGYYLVPYPSCVPSELSVLRLELDLNQAKGEGFQGGYAYAQFLCQGDVNALRQACQQELGAIVAECNSRLEACEK